MRQSHRADFMHGLVGLIGLIFLGILECFYQHELIPSALFDVSVCLGEIIKS